MRTLPFPLPCQAGSLPFPVSPVAWVHALIPSPSLLFPPTPGHHDITDPLSTSALCVEANLTCLASSGQRACNPVLPPASWQPLGCLPLSPPPKQASLCDGDLLYPVSVAGPTSTRGRGSTDPPGTGRAWGSLPTGLDGVRNRLKKAESAFDPGFSLRGQSHHQSGLCTQASLHPRPPPRIPTAPGQPTHSLRIPSDPGFPQAP